MTSAEEGKQSYSQKGLRKSQKGPSTTVNIFETAVATPGRYESSLDRAESSVAWERGSARRKTSGDYRTVNGGRLPAQRRSEDTRSGERQDSRQIPIQIREYEGKAVRRKHVANCHELYLRTIGCY
jgi:hypothetical protein